jgi:hypothetical protein
MNLSGSVGYTLLKHKYLDKYVLLFADVHDDVTYCNNSNNIMIDTFLNNKSYNNILLEEIIREDFKLTDLWPSSPHTQKLKLLNKNNARIRPVDIRPLLVPFSWEILENNNTMGEMKFKTYLTNLNDLFNLKPTKLILKYILPEINIMKDDMKFKVSLKTHFYEMRKLFSEFKESYKHLMNYTLNYIYNNDVEVLYTLNEIISAVMEWYTLILIHNNNMNTIVHVGLAHSEKLLEFLIHVYQFRKTLETGINQLEDIPNINENINACVILPSNIDNIF